MFNILIYTIEYTKKGKKYNYHAQNYDFLFNLSDGNVAQIQTYVIDNFLVKLLVPVVF